jgi:solute carrier family 41
VLISNTALVQIQAIVVSFSASIFTYSTIIVEGHPFILKHFVSLSLTAILTASVASFILSTIMVTLAIICRKCKIDPDNICTPIAAMLGDVTTLIFLISFGTLLTYNRNTMFVAQSIALVLLLCSTIIWIKIASKNQITYEVLKNGWYIIFIAMMISSAGGYVLKCAINKFQSLASFQVGLLVIK